MPPIKTTEVWQNLISQVFAEEIKLDPEDVQRFFVNNLIQRTLAHLVGQGKKKAIPIRSTEAGALVVAMTGLAFEDQQVDATTFPDDEADQIVYTHVVSRIDITIWTNPVLLRLSPDGTRWGDWIERNADSEYSFDCAVTKLEIKNKTPTQNARYQLIGWY